MPAKKKKSASKTSKASTAAKKKAKQAPKAKTPKVAKKPAKAKAPKARKPGKAKAPVNRRGAQNATVILHALVGVLAQRKLVDADTYVAPLGDLLEEAGYPRTAAVAVTKAKALRKHLTLTVPTSARGAAAEGALVGFVEDAKRIVSRPELLVGLLHGMLEPSNQLFTLAQLGKKLFADDQKPFETHWNEAIGERRLPSEIGALRTNGKFLLFFLGDIVQSPPRETRNETPVPAVEPPPPSTPVRDRLLEAFNDLDVAGGRRNYVTLFDLRNRLPDVGRDGFDAAVNELRREWILTLDPAEGRHERLPEQVLAAGIMDQSSLMVYAARRDT